MPCLNPSNAEATFVRSTKALIFEKHLNLVMLGFIEYLSLSTLRWVPHVPGFQSFLVVFLHHFVLAKLATNSIRVTHIEVMAANLPQTHSNVYWPSYSCIHVRYWLSCSKYKCFFLQKNENADNKQGNCLIIHLCVLKSPYWKCFQGPLIFFENIILELISNHWNIWRQWNEFKWTHF